MPYAGDTMSDAPDKPGPAPHPGPLDFSETAYGMVQHIIRKADPEAELDADPADEEPESRASGRQEDEARRAIGGE